MWGLECRQYDIVTAFLNALADKVICVQQPPGFEESNDFVCQLIRALYGLKQLKLRAENKCVYAMKELSSYL